MSEQKQFDEPKSEALLKEEKILPREISFLRETLDRYLSESIKISIEESTKLAGEKGARLFAVEEHFRQKMVLGEVTDELIDKLLSYKKPPRMRTLDKVWFGVPLDTSFRQSITETMTKYCEASKTLTEFVQKNTPQEIFAMMLGFEDYELKGKIAAKARGNVLLVYLENREDFVLFELGKKNPSMEDKSRAEKIGAFSSTRRGIPIIVFNAMPGKMYKSTTYHEVAHQLFGQVLTKEKEEIEIKNPIELGEDFFRSWQKGAEDELLAQMKGAIGHYGHATQYNPPSEWLAQRILTEHIGPSTARNEEKEGLYDYPYQEKKPFLQKIKDRFVELLPEKAEELYQQISKKYYEFIKDKTHFLTRVFGELPRSIMMRDFYNILRGEDITKWERTYRLLKILGENADEVFEVAIKKHQERFALEHNKKTGLIEDVMEEGSKTWKQTKIDRLLHRYQGLLEEYEKLKTRRERLTDFKKWKDQCRYTYSVYAQAANPTQQGLAVCHFVNVFLQDYTFLLKRYDQFFIEELKGKP